LQPKEEKRFRKEGQRFGKEGKRFRGRTGTIFVLFLFGMLCNIVLIVQEAEHKEKKGKDSEKKGKDSEKKGKDSEKGGKDSGAEQVQYLFFSYLVCCVILC
jgi:hypothetical protein